MVVTIPGYTGRFAPTPSGPLHFGSIVAALGSFLDARSHNGQWLVRIEDIDTPRIMPGASDLILQGLERLGLYWDGEVIFQSQRLEAYHAALSVLQTKKLAYRCYCPRRLTKGKPYPGTCRDQIRQDRRHAIRVVTVDDQVTIQDSIQGRLSRNIRQDVGDFILHRSDKLIAYHLAVVVDDAWQNISHIVRGVDLWCSTPQQVYLQRLLEITTPDYMHLPIAVDEYGSKISKQNQALDALLHHTPGELLVQALDFMGQSPDKLLTHATVSDILQWAVENWNAATIPRCHKIPVNHQSPITDN